MSKKEQTNGQPKGTLYVTPLEDVLPASMLPYAEEVILDRALPRVEDGLKPVQRRILYTMYEMGLTPDKPHKKSARIVGDCMGKYHPHGDSSVYDAMVRMAQEFNMGKTLVNGHGNFGSIDGDPAAAMRYTEARLEPIALELLRDLDKNTVNFALNFDDSLKEPKMLPGRFPNLLVNGASGIAVGLATNIPPHNLGECIDGVVAYIEKPSIKLNELVGKIKAPDFPTGGYIIANELNQAYKTGRGKITLRAKIRIEDGDNENKKNLVIYELPYQVNKANLLRRIAELRDEKKEDFAFITKVGDESDRNGMRAVVEIRADSDINKCLALLYKHTDLETTFGMNMVAIAKGKPMQLGLVEIIKHYVEYQREVVLRRTKFDLNQAKERCHILEGLIIAVRNIDEVIKIIKNAESTSDARDKLRERFSLSEKQAQAILDLRLARLTKLEVFKLEEELKRLRELIEKLTAIVGSTRLQLQVVNDEILEIKKKYKTPRRSQLVFSEEEAAPERADVKLPGVASYVLVSGDDKLKCVSEKNFNMSNKTVGEKSKPDAVAKLMLNALSDETVLVFSNKGNCYPMEAGAVGCKFGAGGFALKDVFETADKTEKPVALLKPEKEGNLLFFTKHGMIKRTARGEYPAGKNIYPALRLNDGDELLCVEPERDALFTAFFVTKGGMCLNAKKDDVPLQGRISGGVKGMNLKAGDEVLFASQIDGEGEIIVATSAGRYKRVIAAQIDPISRNCKGVKIASLTTESVVFADYVTVPYVLALLLPEGGMAELNTEDISIDATNTRGRAVKSAKFEPKAVYAMKYRTE